jgi:predicted lipoprotein
MSFPVCDESLKLVILSGIGSLGTIEPVESKNPYTHDVWRAQGSLDSVGTSLRDVSTLLKMTRELIFRRRSRKLNVEHSPVAA